jgi:ubiquinone biosynthesis protein UbiJ
MERQIIAIANQLIQKGKKPTVATVKAKLTQPVAMPLLLRTLQKFGSMTQEQIAELVCEQPISVPASDNAQNNELAALKQQVNQLHSDVARLKQQLNDIENLLKRAPE